MQEKKTHKTSVGGQALIEGIMMQGPKGMATAVRKPDGDILTEYHEFHRLREKYKFLGWPLVRGAVNFFESMVIGYKTLMYSAEVSGMEEVEEEEMSKFERWLTDKLGDKLMKVLTGVASVLGFALAFLIFFYLPVLLFNVLNKHFDGTLTPAQGTIEGVTKIIIFVVYIALVSRMKDIRRTFMYHGAEHKTIACYEAGDPLTVENVRKYTRFHPRCGTSFLILVVIVSVFLYSVLPWGSIGLRVVCKLLLLPLVMGISYELLKWCGRSDNFATRIIRQPGIWVQHLTVFEPDDSMIEVAIAAVTPVLPENPEEGKW